MEHERPRHVVIQPVGNEQVTITYTFERVAAGTLFRRVVKGAEDDTVTDDTEQQSMANLKTLIEAILANEQKGPIYP